MRLFTATNKTTGQKWYYSQRRIFGRTEYTADCAGHAFEQPTWHATLKAAKVAALARGTFEPVR